MNIRKNIDYSEMYAELDKAMAADIPQMELYCKIGKAVCKRTEKGAAVAAAAYLSKQYPDVQGFSPRNLRRMRDFYRSCQDQPALLSLAMELGWTQNVVILESGLSTELREWYLKATMQFGWSKGELSEKIESNAHEMIVLAADDVVCYSGEQGDSVNQKKHGSIILIIHSHIQMTELRVKLKNGDRRRWLIMMCLIISEKRIAFSARRVLQLLLFDELFRGGAGAGYTRRRASAYNFRC